MSIPEQTAASPASEPVVPKAVLIAPETETAVASPAAEATSTATDGEPAAAPAKEAKEETKKDEAAVEATPVSEGSLGYKAHGLLK
jgi:hypothetical protein